MADDTVRVPPGHKVVVVHPTHELSFGQSQSGVWILNLGQGPDLARGLDLLERFTAQTTQASVIWILTGALLESIPDYGRFLRRVADVCEASFGRIAHIAVFPDDVPSRATTMRAFRRIGMGVHYGGPDRACFVEVHRPDGIVVGMPGAVLEGETNEA